MPSENFFLPSQFCEMQASSKTAIVLLHKLKRDGSHCGVHRKPGGGAEVENFLILPAKYAISGLKTAILGPSNTPDLTV
jgi:hypothetical protein